MSPRRLCPTLVDVLRSADRLSQDRDGQDQHDMTAMHGETTCIYRVLALESSRNLRPLVQGIGESFRATTRTACKVKNSQLRGSLTH